MGYRIGIDVGGTFTDFTLVRSDGQLLLWKEDTTPDDPARAVGAGIEALASQLGLSGSELLAACDLFVHGTTTATNLLIERSGPVVGLLCSEGFRDVLYFRNGHKPDRFNLHVSPPVPLIDRWLRIGVRGRFDARGNELQPLHEDQVRAAAQQFRAANVEAVAVAFLWAMLFPAHELQAAEILREELPQVEVLCSHNVLPEIGEWERTSAVSVSTYILPRIRSYLTNLEEFLAQKSLEQPPLIMQSNGGCARIPEILKSPVTIVASGPAAAPAAAAHLAEILGRDLISVDMGGTSFDVCLIDGGRAAMTREMQVAGQPVGVMAVDVQSIGAGGGSIAWVDEGGALRVGPQSARSDPGPACYGKGGTEATVTDANLVLGYLDPGRFLGGRRRLRDDLSRDALATHIGTPLGLSPEEAAAGVVRVVNANMVGAIRTVSVGQGIDPRRFTLVCGGGAGGLHAAELARDLGIPRVFIPLEAGVFCSFGMTVTDVRHDYSATLHGNSTALDLTAINDVLSVLEEQAREDLREEGFADTEIRFERSVDARYAGQIHQMTVTVPYRTELTDDDVATLEDTFHRQHQARYNHDRRGLPLETLHWRLTAIGRVQHGRAPRAACRATADGSAVATGRRAAYASARTRMEPVPTYVPDTIRIGASIEGPALVDLETTTILVPVGDTLVRDVPEGFTILTAPTHAKAASDRF